MHLVGTAAFKAVETSDPRLAGSIPVHLRQSCEVAPVVVPLTTSGATSGERRAANDGSGHFVAEGFAAHEPADVVDEHVAGALTVRPGGT